MLGNQRTLRLVDLCRVGRRRSSSTRTYYKVAVALSGGVDSSVAAALLSFSEDHDVLACLHMTNWNPYDTHTETGGGGGASCSGVSDWSDAQATAQHLGLPIRQVQFQSEYFHYVFEPFLKEIAQGRMPNPDIRCNQYMKFGVLKDYVRNKYGLDTWLATGHYARLWHRSRGGDDAAATITILQPPECLRQTLEENPILAEWLLNSSLVNAENDTVLLQGCDSNKDQSYFLAGCNSATFRNVMFPLGDMHKKSAVTSSSLSRSVRQIALDLNLPTANKRESMGICAVGKQRGSFRDFVHDYLPPSKQSVVFVDVDTGQIVGHEPDSYAFLYTMGQGAKLGGSKERYFVADMDLANNQVLVCAGTHHPALYTNSLELDMQWILPKMVDIMGKKKKSSSSQGSYSSLRVSCRIRHLQPLMNATLILKDGGEDSSKWILELDHPTRAVTPGQMAVLYLGLVCLGGGPILRRGSTLHERNTEILPDIVYRSSHNDTSVVERN